MCNPLLLGVASFATGAAQAVTGYMAQNENAENVAKAARAAEAQEGLEITRRQMQEADATAQRTAAVGLEEAERVAEAQVAGAEAGISGVSLDNIVGDITRRAARDRVTLDENARMTGQQLQLEKRSAGIRSQSRINSAPRPTALSLVAGLGTSALSGYTSYDKMMG